MILKAEEPNQETIIAKCTKEDAVDRVIISLCTTTSSLLYKATGIKEMKRAKGLADCLAKLIEARIDMELALKEKDQFKITYHIHSEDIITRMEEFLNKKIIPLKEKHPYAEIHIEVQG